MPSGCGVETPRRGEPGLEAALERALRVVVAAVMAALRAAGVDAGATVTVRPLAGALGVRAAVALRSVVSGFVRVESVAASGLGTAVPLVAVERGVIRVLSHVEVLSLRSMHVIEQVHVA